MSLWSRRIFGKPEESLRYGKGIDEHLKVVSLQRLGYPASSAGFSSRPVVERA